MSVDPTHQDDHDGATEITALLDVPDADSEPVNRPSVRERSSTSLLLLVGPGLLLRYGHTIFVSLPDREANTSLTHHSTFISSFDLAYMLNNYSGRIGTHQCYDSMRTKA